MVRGSAERAISASRRVEAPSRHRGDSFPGMMAVGGRFFDFGPVRTASIYRVATSPEMRSNSTKRPPTSIIPGDESYQ